MGEMLDRDCIKSNLESVHNYESFGRTLIAVILEETIKQLGDTCKEKVHLTADISVTGTGEGCHQHCIDVGGRLICYTCCPPK